MPHPENIQWSPDRHRPQFLDSPFGARKTANQFVQLSIDPSQGLTRKRYGWYSNGSLFDDSHFSEVEAGIRLETGATGTDTARIRSAYPGQYISQAVATPGIGLTVDDGNVEVSDGESSLTHGEIYAGAFYWDETNDEPETGLGFKWDADGWHFFVRSDGAHLGPSPIPQSEWGVDTADGEGHTGRVFSPADGYVFNMPFTWYNEGPLGGSLLDPVSNHVQELVRVAIEGRPSTSTPNLPIQLVVRNDGTADLLGVELGGMQYTTYGGNRGDLSRRKTVVARVTPTNYVSTTRETTADEVIDPISTPGDYLMAARRSAADETANIRLSGLEVTPTGGDVIIAQWDEYDNGAAITDPNFESPTAAVDPQIESILEVDTAATDYTPSVAAFRGMDFFSGGTGGSVDTTQSEIDLRIPLGATRVLTALNMGNDVTLNPVAATFDESY